MRKLLLGLGAVALLAATSAFAGVQAPRRTIVLTIPHTAHGCHAWSDGHRTTPDMRLRMHPGDRLVLVNMDIDNHRLVQMTGPERMAVGGPMGMRERRIMVFRKRGTYRFTTRVTEMHMLATEHGRKNTLRLTLLVS